MNRSNTELFVKSVRNRLTRKYEFRPNLYDRRRRALAHVSSPRRAGRGRVVGPEPSVVGTEGLYRYNTNEQQHSKEKNKQKPTIDIRVGGGVDRRALQCDGWLATVSDAPLPLHFIGGASVAHLADDLIRESALRGIGTRRDSTDCGGQIATGAVSHIGGSEAFLLRRSRHISFRTSAVFLPYKVMNLFPGRVLGKCRVQPEPVARSLTHRLYLRAGPVLGSMTRPGPEPVAAIAVEDRTRVGNVTERWTARYKR
ncbi:hypothetical protein EVAR_96099_1 [Eumeta japonica]|uniref:Uncharacterized protein n=1 Tax=Eumeta variegata TaxID=151549 RepID=A0A4C1VDZ3_EUMVA|nr:hypothetical protein EVAR_96099_1 [Eumeta japonica]